MILYFITQMYIINWIQFIINYNLPQIIFLFWNNEIRHNNKNLTIDSELKLFLILSLNNSLYLSSIVSIFVYESNINNNYDTLPIIHHPRPTNLWDAPRCQLPVQLHYLVTCLVLCNLKLNCNGKNYLTIRHQ